MRPRTRRPLALALGLVLLGSTLAPPPAAASGWTVSASTSLVSAYLLGAGSGPDVTLALSNQTDITPFGSSVAAAILDALGFGGGYSQEASWPAGADPSVTCPSSDLPFTCWPTSRTLLIPGSIQAFLAVHANAGGTTTVDVAPGYMSLAFDVSTAAVGMALEALTDAPSLRPDALDVATLALQLSPAAAGAVTALLRNDQPGALAQLLALAKQAAKAIIAHAERWVEATGLSLALNLLPGVLEVRLGIAAAQAIVVLGNLDVALLTGHSSTGVAVGYAGGGGAAAATVGSTTLSQTAGGRFSSTGPATSSFSASWGVVLQDGRVLIGRSTGWLGTDADTTELYDPRTGTFAEIPSPNAFEHPWHGSSATVLRDGRVLIVGGWVSSATSLQARNLASAVLFDPRSEQFTATGDLGTARGGIIVAPLPNGQVLVAGGTYVTDIGTMRSVETAELYDPISGLFRPTGPLNDARSGSMAAALPDGRIVIAGGTKDSDQGTGSVDSIETYSPGNGTFTRVGVIGTDRFGPAVARLPDGRLLIIGGSTFSPAGGNTLRQDYLASAEVFDPTTRASVPVGEMTSARPGASVAVLPSGRVLIAGGNPSHDGQSLSTAEIFDPATGLFTPTASMRDRRMDALTVVLADGSVLIEGGQTGWGQQGITLTSAEIFRESK